MIKEDDDCLTFIIPGVPGSVHRHLDALAVDRGLDGAGVQADRQVETLPSPRPSNKPQIRAQIIIDFWVL